MPIYEYACAKCGHQLDALQKISDPPLRKCPECGALRLKKLVSAPQFRLKGSGWYETDFKKDGRKRLVDGGDAPPAGDKDGAAGKSEASDKTDKTDKPAKSEGKDAAAKPVKADVAAKKKGGKGAAKSAAAD